MKCARIFVSLLHPLSSTVRPLSLMNSVTPQWNLIPQWRSDCAYYVSRAGRVYERGKALNDHVEEKEGDLVTGYFTGSFSEIALINRPIYNTVGKIWKKFFETDSTRDESHAAGTK